MQASQSWVDFSSRQGFVIKTFLRLHWPTWPAVSDLPCRGIFFMCSVCTWVLLALFALIREEYMVDSILQDQGSITYSGSWFCKSAQLYSSDCTLSDWVRLRWVYVLVGCFRGRIGKWEDESLCWLDVSVVALKVRKWVYVLVGWLHGRMAVRNSHPLSHSCSGLSPLVVHFHIEVANLLVVFEWCLIFIVYPEKDSDLSVLELCMSLIWIWKLRAKPPHSIPKNTFIAKYVK